MMFREMRRKKQMLSTEECIHILEEGTSGVLALSGDGGYPYAVPISYVYAGSKLYFHSAKSGHKLDAIGNCSKASFCVIAQDKIIPEKYTTHYRSVIAFGQIRILDDDREKKAAIEALALKYSPGESSESRQDAITQSWPSLCLIELSVEHLSGKEAAGLTPV